MKRPSFQFYPADWRKDNELRSCSVAARGLWTEMMVLAHECVPYGHLAINGKAMTPDEVARLTAVGFEECENLISELEVRGVFSRTDGGIIFSRRMVKDEEVRNARAAGGEKGKEYGQKGKEYGIKGGRPRQDRGDNKPPLKPAPSSSSSASTIKYQRLDRFDEFWLVCPKKVGRGAAEKAWPKAALASSPESLIAAMRAYAAVCSGKEKQFIVHPTTWLAQKRWLDEGIAPVEIVDQAKIDDAADKADRYFKRNKYAEKYL